ncbi:hypothetical protein [Legionella beliardensis]|nr:hypothetical protein [Legionella beliardensis]
MNDERLPDIIEHWYEEHIVEEREESNESEDYRSSRMSSYYVNK